MSNHIKRVLVMVNEVSGGGAERVAQTQMRLLHGCGGFDVAAATCGEGPDFLPESRRYRLRHFLETPGTKLSGTLGAGLNRDAVRRCLKEFRPEVVHLHAFVQFSPGAIAELLAYRRESGCRVFLTHHTYHYICPNDGLFNFRTWKICEKCVGGSKTHILRDRCYGGVVGSCGKYIQKRRFYGIFRQGLVDLHIAPGEFMRDMLLREDPRLKVSVVPNPCLREIRGDMPEKAGGKLVYFGRMSREKNVPALVEAMERIRTPCRLLLVGDGPESGALERKIRESPARERIRFCRGFLPPESLYKEIEDAQLYVLPSVWYENSPVAIVEALNLGMVPLVSGIGGMREMVERMGVGYCFEPGSATAIARAVDRAATNAAADRQRLDDARREQLAPFTEAAYLTAILSLYERWGDENGGL